MSDAALLAIDSSTELLCVAACAGGRSAVRCVEGGARASQMLLGHVRDVLRETGLAPGDLQAIGFGRGPGAFTGLRTACAVAQGLAFGLELRLVPVDSLLIVAEAACARAADLAVVMDARMGQVYAGRYAWEAAGRWTVREPPGLWMPADVAAAWHAADPPHAWTGTGIGLLPPNAARHVLPTDCAARAAALLRLVQMGWQAGATVAPAAALPLYIRDKVALTTAERAAAAALRDAA